jgi:hypothetical protein
VKEKSVVGTAFKPIKSKKKKLFYFNKMKKFIEKNQKKNIVKNIDKKS